MKICHLTSVHKRFDTRIFVKECQSLSNNNFNISLIVADNLGNDFKNNIKIYDVGKEDFRIKRFFLISKKIYKKALKIDADIYHFHDPELIRIGKKLLKNGKKVIYDVHEDVPRQILNKPYLNGFLKKVISVLFEKYENRNVKKFSYIITATDFIKNRFLKLNKNTESIKNYPKIDELKFDINWNKKKNFACYIGAFSKQRGIKEIVKALEFTEFKLNLAGKFVTKSYKNEVENLKTWKKVVFHGFVNRKQVNKILAESKVGLVTLHPIINYKDALPVKMFEYMLAAIPVISTDIPLWKKIVEDNDCGICVDALNPKKIGQAINKLIKNNNLAKKMGENGRKAVLEKFNWQNEEIKLLRVYKFIDNQ